MTYVQDIIRTIMHFKAKGVEIEEWTMCSRTRDEFEKELKKRASFDRARQIVGLHVVDIMIKPIRISESVPYREMWVTVSGEYAHRKMSEVLP